MKRIESIDILRGLIMILMALDHVRDYFHNDAFVHDPLDPSTTTYALYFTRWITHYCAPLFVFLSGMSAWLSGQKKSSGELSHFLFKRGLWLIAAEFILVTFGWTFNPAYPVFVMQVIWAIGVSMIALSGLIWLSDRWILITSLAILLLHNLLDYPEAARNGQVGFIWDLLHHGHFILYPISPDHGFLVVYPILPWIGIIGLGYALGKWMLRPDRKTIFLKTGIAMCFGFLLLRFVNVYGDPRPWHVLSLFTFLDTAKYPPSLAFTLMTLGPGFIFLALFESAKGKLADFLIAFGRVPFFFYVVHIYLIHILCVGVFYMSGFGADKIVSPGIPFLFRPPELGFDLPLVYLVWICIIALLYIPCKKYDQWRLRKGYWWMKYC